MEFKFSFFDKNGNGKLDGSEFELFKSATQHAIDEYRVNQRIEDSDSTKETIRKLLAEDFFYADSIDGNADGKISIGEVASIKQDTIRELKLSEASIKGLLDLTQDEFINKIVSSEETAQFLEDSYAYFQKFDEQTIEDFYNTAKTMTVENAQFLTIYIDEIKITATKAEQDVYFYFNWADKNKDGRISYGQELRTFISLFSSNKNNIITSDDMDKMQALTGLYYLNPYTIVKGKKIRQVNLNEDRKLGTTDVTGSHRFTKPGEAFVFGDLCKNYGIENFGEIS